MPCFDGPAAETAIQLAVIACTEVNLWHLTQNTTLKSANSKNRINSARSRKGFYLLVQAENFA
jgi:hypothetical protein